MVIAIDGPAGSGKGSVANIIANDLNILYIDTGATYRAVSLAILENNIDINDREKIVALAKTLDIKLTKDLKVYLNNIDVTDKIRSKEVSDIVSIVSKIEEVREILVDLQRKMIDGDAILEGRDITTVVCPNADFKFYLDASLEERIKRRMKQNERKGINMTYEEVYNNIKTRDYNDTHKEIGALKRTADQIYIDTSNMTKEEVATKMLEIVRSK